MSAVPVALMVRTFRSTAQWAAGEEPALKLKTSIKLKDIVFKTGAVLERTAHQTQGILNYR